MAVFEPYFDGPDLTACVPADTTVQALNQAGQAHQAQFPLWLEETQTLGELFLSARATSRGFRYGSLGDNVLGLRWVLPNGHKVDLGGRVVKNVAGFDFVRFLSASQGRLGRPELLILRLRPRAEAERCAKFSGPWPALERLAGLVRASSWAHAVDAFDLEADGRGGALYAHFGHHGSLMAPFENAVHAWALNCKLSVDLQAQLPRHQAKPWARAQAPLGQLCGLAEAWVEEFGGRVTGFMGQGVLHLEPADPVAAAANLARLHHDLGASGGHVEHPSLLPVPDAPQARWEAELLKKMADL